VLELLKRSLEMKEKAGAEKASILANFGLIAETYSNVGTYSEVGTWCSELKSMKKGTLGGCHQDHHSASPRCRLGSFASCSLRCASTRRFLCRRTGPRRLPTSTRRVVTRKVLIKTSFSLLLLRRPRPAGGGGFAQSRDCRPSFTWRFLLGGGLGQEPRPTFSWTHLKGQKRGPGAGGRRFTDPRAAVSSTPLGRAPASAATSACPVRLRLSRSASAA
jgi:hypothetical protein